MSVSTVPSYHQKRNASHFRSLINDLKRRPEDAAVDLGISLRAVKDILSGEAEITKDIIDKALQVWPVSPRDFFLLRDDSPSGVKIMRARESQNSARVMSRAGKDYYEYRDTAMSSVAAFRPEWIQELCIVDDNDPENPAIQWNNGHFLHQFTYFVGPVNFYYRSKDGTKKVAVMNTGDSMYISPFVPHTFATRSNDAGELGLILALTYSNKLGGEAQQELSLFGPEQAANLVMDFSSEAKASGALIKFHREALSMPKHVLAELVGIESNLVEAIEDGSQEAPLDLMEKIAYGLKVPLREILSSGAGEDAVTTSSWEQSRKWSITNDEGETVYRLVELCGSKALPFSKALEIVVSESSNTASSWLKTGLHQYVYNLGPNPVRLLWVSDSKSYEDEIEPGASFYMKPGVEHAFHGDGCKLLVLRIGGRVGGDVLHELGQIGREHLDRVVNESMPWFNSSGRTNV